MTQSSFLQIKNQNSQYGESEDYYDYESEQRNYIKDENEYYETSFMNEYENI